MREKEVIRRFALKWSTSARVENLLRRKANEGLGSYGEGRSG